MARGAAVDRGDVAAEREPGMNACEVRDDAAMTASSPQRTGERRWPSVAVVVPTRNRPELLKRSVASILDQSYPGRLECIVVFDRSEPVPVAVQVPTGRQLRLIANTRRPGLAGARNSGILAGVSDLVAFCDDDDAWLPDRLSLQVERLEFAAAEFVSCGTRFHYSDRIVPRAAPPTVDLQQLARRRFPELGAPTFLIRRTALDEIGLIDEDIPGSYGEDYDLLLRAARRGPIVAVERPLIDVYWHQQSFFTDRWQTIIDGLRYLLDKHPELSADKRGLARIQGQIAFAEAAMARRSRACRTSTQALRSYPLERRAYIALAVASGIVPAASVARLANRRGRGI